MVLRLCERSAAFSAEVLSEVVIRSEYKYPPVCLHPTDPLFYTNHAVNIAPSNPCQFNSRSTSMFHSFIYLLIALLLLSFNSSQTQFTFNIMSAPSVASSTGSKHGTVSPDDTYDTFNIDFNPERDEAICSTIEFKRDFSKTLPQLRDTAKKYGRWTPRPQPDVAINTSALARAFPGFSQAGSPNDTFSLEIPRGHKGKQQTTYSGALTFSGDINSPMVDLPNNLRLMRTPKRGDAAQPAIFEDATRNNTQPHNTTDIPPQTHFTEQKENIPPLPQQKPTQQNATKRTQYTSNASRTISGERKSLKELHARVADESDGSFIGTERPASVTFQPKNTRFSQPTKASNAETAKPQPLPKANAKKKQQPHLFTPTGNTPKPPNATQQSFFVESVLASASNTQSNGLPVVQHGQVIKGGSRSFGPVDGMDLPEEEEDIYEYARKLKAQVAQLEIQLADANKTINDNHREDQLIIQSAHAAARNLVKQNEELFDENVALKNQLADTREKKMAEDLLENGRLAHENQALRRQLDQITDSQEDSTRTWQRQEFAFKSQVEKLLAEKEENTRSFQHQQCALKNQVEQILAEKEENTRASQNQQSALKNQVDQLLLEKEQNNRKWQQRETALRNKIQRRDEIVHNLTTTISQQIKESTQKSGTITTTRTSKSTSGRTTKQKSNSKSHEQDLPSKVMKQAQDHVEEIKAASVHLNSSRHQQSVGRNQNQNQNQHIQETRAASPALDFNLHQQAFSRSPQQHNSIIAPNEQNDDTQVTQEASFDDGTEELQNQTQNSNDDSLSDVSTNYSSIVGHGFMPEVRQFLKNAKASKKEKLEAAEQAAAHEDTIQSGRSSRAPSVMKTGDQPADDTIQTIQSGRSSRAPSVKGFGGILKNSSAPAQEDLTGRFSLKSVKSNGHNEQAQTTRSHTHRRHRSQVEEDLTTKSNTSHRRHHSETTVHINTRRHADGDDMTSAYLAADIEAAKQGNGKERPVLSASARQVLDGLCEHNRKNCTICLRLASFDTKSASKTTIRIQKPIPVSKRAPSPVPYEDEPTIRPAVAPGVALATVLKALEDEVAHLKMRQSEVQQAYVKHDASLGRRQREALKVELESLLKQIESKSNQIYSLYDVLEGQAEAGQEMTQQELEIELKRMSYDPMDIDDELPWEGIEESVY